MKKWYQSVRVMLVSALIVQSAGCASTRFAFWPGRDRDEKNVAEIDGKAAKDSAAKDPKAKLPSVAKKSKDKSSDQSDDQDRIVAKPIDPKSIDKKAAPADKNTETRVASKATAKSESSREQRLADPFAEEDAAPATPPAMAATKSTAPPPSKPISPGIARTGSATKPASADVDLPEWARDAAATAGVNQAMAEASPGTRSRIQEVSHRGLAVDAPAWATDEASKPQTPAKTAAKTVTHLQPGAPAPASAQPSTPAAPRQSLVQLCPSARGEVRQLVQSLDSADAEVLKRTIHRLGRMQSDGLAATPALRKLLQHPDGFVRVHAALALVRMRQTSPEITDTLIFGLRSADPGVRSFAAAVLAEMGPNSADALPALSAALRDRDGYVRLHVAEVLIAHNDWSELSMQTLVDCLRDRDENVRWLTTYSLAELAPQSFEAVTALSASLRDPVSKVRIGAAYALGEIGPMARSAVPELRRCADGNDTELQSAAVYALRQITAE